MAEYVFVISPGRSGTNYLTELFHHAQELDSTPLIVEHEPIPVCCGDPMIQWNDGVTDSMRRLVAIKKQQIDQRRDSHVYFEGNAQFIKGFGWEFMKALTPEQHKKVGVIWLVRNPQHVIASFLANREAPGFDTFADTWNIRPGCVKAVVPIENEATSCYFTPTPESAIEWQVNEINKRAELFHETYPEVQFYRAELESLNTVQGVLELFSFFNLKASDNEALSMVIGKAQNTGSERGHVEEQTKWSVDRQTANSLTPEKQVELVEQVARLIIEEVGEKQISEKRRAILGMDDCISCMVGAKFAINTLYSRICSIISAEIDFTDFRWNLICQIVEYIDANDSMFQFVTKVSRGRFILDGLNGPQKNWTDDDNNENDIDNNIHKDNKPFVICITGGIGRIGRQVLVGLLSSPELYLPATACNNFEVRLLLKNESKHVRTAQGFKEDLSDGDFGNHNISLHTDALTAFDHCNLAILCASAPFQPHYERYHLAVHQVKIYKEHALALDAVADSNCQIVVMGNPVITVANLIMQVAPRLSQRVTSVTEIDDLRAKQHIISLAKKIGIVEPIKGLTDVYAFGNHSTSTWIDCSGSRLQYQSGSTTVSVRDLLGYEYLVNELQHAVRNRGRDIITLSGTPCVYSAASSVLLHIKFVLGCSGAASVQSMGVCVRDFREWRELFNGMELPSTISCVCLPCERDIKSGLIRPHISSIQRAVKWSPYLIQSMKESIRELIEEVSVIQYAFIPDSVKLTKAQLPMGVVVTSRMKEARKAVQEADYILILAGAGMSVSGGIPDITNFAAAFPAVVERGINSIFKASSHAHFVDNPESAWGFWGARARSYAAATPDASYSKLLQICQQKKGFFVCTSNIDRFFARSGYSEDHLLELHASIFDLQCVDLECPEPVIRVDTEFFHKSLEIDEAQWMASESCIPRCSTCGKSKRIATELATDGYFRKDFVAAQRKKYHAFNRSISPTSSVVVLEIGCGVVMSKLRDQANRIARVRGLQRQSEKSVGPTTLIRVNTQHFSFESDFSSVVNHIVLPLPADKVVDFLGGYQPIE